MGVTTNQNRTAQDACSILAQRALEAAQPRPTNPDGWLVSVERNLKVKHFADAKALLEDDPDLSAHDLADALTATAEAKSSPVAAPSLPYAHHRYECPRCGCIGGGGWLTVVRRENGTTPLATPCPDCAGTRSDESARHEPDRFEQRYFERDWTQPLTDDEEQQ